MKSSDKRPKTPATETKALDGAREFQVFTADEVGAALREFAEREGLTPLDGFGFGVRRLYWSAPPATLRRELLDPRSGAITTERLRSRLTRVLSTVFALHGREFVPSDPEATRAPEPVYMAWESGVLGAAGSGEWLDPSTDEASPDRPTRMRSLRACLRATYPPREGQTATTRKWRWARDHALGNVLPQSEADLRPDGSARPPATRALPRSLRGAFIPMQDLYPLPIEVLTLTPKGELALLQRLLRDRMEVLFWDALAPETRSRDQEGGPPQEEAKGFQTLESVDLRRRIREASTWRESADTVDEAKRLVGQNQERLFLPNGDSDRLTIDALAKWGPPPVGTSPSAWKKRLQRAFQERQDELRRALAPFAQFA